jgi:penicillin-binding protein 1C
MRPARASLPVLAPRPRRLVVDVVIALVTLLGLGLLDLDYPAERLTYAALESTRFYAADGTLLFERPAEAGGYGVPIALEQVSPWVIAATLASEDQNFRWHPGVDPSAVARAAWLNARAGEFRYGGSTVTQQLAKLLHPEPRTLVGKLREAWDAARLEHTLGKQAILCQYLNRAYYGRGATGIEAAARRYFGKPAKELTLAEATLLALLPRAPSAYDPDRFPERAKTRRAHVLELMRRQGRIDPDQAASASREPIELVSRERAPRARHAVDRLIGDSTLRGDVTTSLDLALQGRIERHLEQHLRRIQKDGAEQAAVLVVRNADARIVAMVGSRDYEDAARHGAVNGTFSRRAAGSTLKPFLYALAFERGKTRDSRILDQESTWTGYQPRNAEGRHHGWVTLERALGSSLNVPAVALLDELGVPALAARLAVLGFREVDPSGRRHGLSLALGGVPVSLVELASGYSALANDGILRKPSLIASAAEGVRVFDADAAREVTRALSTNAARVPEFGLETPLDFPFDVAAKTGTSSAYCDNWTVGYTREFTVAVWVGNFGGKPLRGTLAMDGAAPLFHDAMFEAMRDRVPRSLLSEQPPRTLLETARATGVLELASPRPDSRFLIDPLYPRSMQRVPLRLDPSKSDTSSIARVRYLVDGEVHVEASPRESASLALTAGRHRVKALAFDSGGRQVAASSDVYFDAIENSHATSN